jgi:hypothetical protein
LRLGWSSKNAGRLSRTTSTTWSESSRSDATRVASQRGVELNLEKEEQPQRLAQRRTVVEQQGRVDSGRPPVTTPANRPAWGHATMAAITTTAVPRATLSA